MFKINLSFAGKTPGDLLREKLRVLMQFELSRLLEDLRAETPVDTGEARAGWKVTYNLPQLRATVSNDVDHVKFLNAGSSAQAPTHFIEKVVLRYGKQTNGPIVTYKGQ